MSSNGVARFAPHITGDFEGFKIKFRKQQSHALKIERIFKDKKAQEATVTPNED
jgi:hypothetical protein